jgi:hypothetical protein
MFAASTTFLCDFEHGQGFALRTPHHERRTSIDESYVEYFLGRLNSLSNDYPPERVFNMDEICWRLFEAPRKVLAGKASETVKLQSRIGGEASFTALGAISCAGQKLPLWVFAKGWTAQSERKFGTHPDAIM